jgi:hypothetical protein
MWRKMPGRVLVALGAVVLAGLMARTALAGVAPDGRPHNTQTTLSMQVPTATPVPFICSGLTMGGRLFAYHSVILDLPVGHVYSFAGQSGAMGNWASICIMEYSSSIVFDSMTGREIQRYVNDNRAVPVLNEIARKITINPMPTPAVFTAPVSGTPAPVTRGIPIDPERGGEGESSTIALVVSLTLLVVVATGGYWLTHRRVAPRNS